MAKKKKKSKPTITPVKFKGFGSPTVAKGVDIALDKSDEARAFYDCINLNGLGDNLKRGSLGFFSLPNGVKLRGVVALKDFRKGDIIVNIPYKMAINLGVETDDAIAPGLKLLRDICENLGARVGEKEVETIKCGHYRVLPPFKGDDCMGSTDFFTEEALEALQSPLIAKEARDRRDRINQRFQEEVDADFPKWIDGKPVTPEHLMWATWIINSRCFTVTGAEGENRYYRLLIPWLDMVNHDRSSPHKLTGRAAPGGELKIIAGANIKAGSQINICYGGGVAGNDRFIQDYGFVDGHEDAFDIVAQQILGTRGILEHGQGMQKMITTVDREETLKALRTTSIAEDSALLEKETDYAVRSALILRQGIKEALKKRGEEML